MNIKEFESPSALYRLAPFWTWNDKLEKKELIRQIDEMADKGWGSYFMHSRVGLITDYLSDEWMEMISACAEHAKESGTYAWLYDEDKWPSGFAGGKVAFADEKYRSRALVFIEKGTETDSDTVLSEAEMNGKKYSICKRVSSLGSAWMNNASYVDLMNPEAVKKFIDVTHEKYKKACGNHFGKAIPGIFTDEPCYLLYITYNVPVVPWSEYLPDFFEKQNGYKIEEHLSELFLNEGNYRKTRYDFYNSATNLFIESYTKQYHDWCAENNLIMTGHYMGEDSLMAQIPREGATMRHYKYMDWPGVDKLRKHLNELVAVKQLTSVADQLKKERALCEAFGCMGNQESFYHRKWVADWLAVLGINFINQHLSLYSIRGEGKRDYPTNFFYQQPWWEEEGNFSNYVGRLMYSVTLGKREVNILVIHPIGTAWSEFTPVDKKNGFAKIDYLFNKPLEELSKKLMANKLDFHYGDESIIEEYSYIKNGKYVVGDFEYDTVIIPPCIFLEDNTINLLNEFVGQAGDGRLIGMDGVNLPKLEKHKSANTIEEIVEMLDGYYPDRVKAFDKLTRKNADEIYIHTRIGADGRIILLSNTNKDKETDVSISIPDVKDVKILDLMNGKAYNAPGNLRSGIYELDILFQPAGSVLLVADGNIQASEVAPAFLESGVVFKKEQRIMSSARIWEIAILEDNVYPLDDVTLYMDGKKVVENKPVSKVWYEHFYAAEDGTNFKAEYSFNVSQIPEGEIYAVIEMPENLDRIMLNGNEVNPLRSYKDAKVFDKKKNWKDVNFVKAPIREFVRAGSNLMIIEGRKMNNVIAPGCHTGVADFEDYKNTECDSIYIVGDFSVETYDREEFVIGSKEEITYTGNITNEGYPFYAGKAVYKTKISYNSDTEGELYLKIDDACCAYAKLKINGNDAGIRITYPYIFDVSGMINNGENNIEVEIASTLYNVLGPNRIAGVLDDAGVGWKTFIEHNRFTRKRGLLPFGLGKAYLLKTK